MPKTQKSWKEWKDKTPFADLSHEEQAKIRASWNVRAERECRVAHSTDQQFVGVVKWLAASYGWIEPSDPTSLPEDVQQVMASMTADLREKATRSGSNSNTKVAKRFEQDVLYFRACDRADGAAAIKQSMSVQFKVYVDSKGAGAMAVQPM